MKVSVATTTAKMMMIIIIKTTTITMTMIRSSAILTGPLMDWELDTGRVGPRNRQTYTALSAVCAL